MELIIEEEEREKFEADRRRQGHTMYLDRYETGDYILTSVEGAWLAWLKDAKLKGIESELERARACLADVRAIGEQRRDDNSELLDRIDQYDDGNPIPPPADAEWLAKANRALSEKVEKLVALARDMYIEAWDRRPWEESDAKKKLDAIQVTD